MRQLTRIIPILFLFGCANSAPKPVCDIIPIQDQHSLEYKYGFQVYHDLELARECSEKTGRQIFLMFSSYAGHSTPEDEWKVLADKEVKEILDDYFVFTILYKDDREKLNNIDSTKKARSGKVLETVGEVNSELQISMFQSNALCYYRCLNSELEPISSPLNDLSSEGKDKLVLELKKVKN